jgi:hypothetical protein
MKIGWFGPDAESVARVGRALMLSSDSMPMHNGGMIVGGSARLST